MKKSRTLRLLSPDPELARAIIAAPASRGVAHAVLPRTSIGPDRTAPRAS